MRTSRLRPILLLCGIAAGGAYAPGQQPLLKQSPFLPPPSAAEPAATKQSDLEFTGALLAGAQTQVCITRRQARRSVWIRVGESAAGIEVVSHDPGEETVIIRAEGVTHHLKLKSASPLTAAAPATALRPVTAPVAPVAPLSAPLLDPPPPVTIAEKEREARMLVSDLLEIGMQQRKAYEEARRKAAAEVKKAAAAPESPRPTSR